MLVALLINAAPPKARHHDSGNFMPVGRLLKLRGFPAVMLSSVVTVTALDLLVIYLPALGAERLIDANNIGLLLTVRAAAQNKASPPIAWAPPATPPLLRSG